MDKKTKIRLGALGATAVLAIGGGALVASAGDDSETPITGEELDRASEAALDFTGEGRVTDTEIGDEESYYEVEVTLDNGDQVDVQLDDDFNVVGDETDGAGEDEGDD